MCTASWLLDSTGYQLLFNRDERIGRDLAEPPRFFTSPQGTRFIMPVDPQGQGSWIAVNEYGLTLCLLNHYQGKTPKPPLISRGLLVRNLISLPGAKEIINQVKQSSLSQYAPFTLVIFDSGLSRESGQVRSLQWDGVNLCEFLPNPPLISSAVHADKVRSYRRQLYQNYTDKSGELQARLAFHHSHHPEKGYLSPCMHRPDAHTVSFTHVRVSQSAICMSYQPGSPCQGRPYYHQQMERKEGVCYG